MSHFVFILFLFVLVLVFTQCKDECEDYTGCGCEGSSGPTRQIVGITNFQTKFSGNATAPNIGLGSEYTYALSKPRFSLINSAFACSSGVSLSDFNQFIERDFEVESYSTETLKLLEKPTQSHSFTFSFYYYKDDVLIDSSFTQKFYISQ
jgi:hypothetical protein